MPMPVNPRLLKDRFFGEDTLCLQRFLNATEDEALGYLIVVETRFAQ